MQWDKSWIHPQILAARIFGKLIINRKMDIDGLDWNEVHNFWDKSTWWFALGNHRWHVWFRKYDFPWISRTEDWWSIEAHGDLGIPHWYFKNRSRVFGVWGGQVGTKNIKKPCCEAKVWWDTLHQTWRRVVTARNYWYSSPPRYPTLLKKSEGPSRRESYPYTKYTRT